MNAGYSHIWRSGAGSDLPVNLTGQEWEEPDGRVFVQITDGSGTTAVLREELVTVADWKAGQAAAAQKTPPAGNGAGTAPPPPLTATATANTGAKFKPFTPPKHVPHLLREMRNWIGWRERWNAATGKVDKLPVCITTGTGEGFLRPENHVDYDTAVKAIKRLKLSGVGFALTKDCGVIGGDLDQCRDPVSGAIAPWAMEIINLAETYCEVSPSGKGIRFFALGKLPNGASCIKYNPAGVELYAGGRFLTFTGNHLPGTPREAQEAPKTIEALIARINAKRAADAAHRAGQADPPPPGDQDTEEFKRWCARQTPLGKINQLALADLEAWVPQLFPSAVFYDTGKYWRVHSADRGRPDLQEDLSFHPDGIKDWAVHDIGDHREGKRSAIDIVIEFGLGLADLDQPGALEAALADQDNVEAAARRLAGQLQISDEDFYAMGFPRPNPPTDDKTLKPVDLWPAEGAPILPEGLLPARIETFARASATMIGADEGGIATAALAAAAGAIDDAIKLRVMKNNLWMESARLWVALLGDPSSKKTPIINAVMAALKQADHELYRNYAMHKSFWDALPKAQKQETPEPIRRRRVIGDTTAEAAQEAFKTETRGLMGVYGELSVWFGSMERYSPKSGSSERGFWLQAYDGGPYPVDRIGRGSIMLPNLSLTMLGGAQPDLIRKVVSQSIDDGLVQRLIPVVLTPGSPPSEDAVDSGATADFDTLIRQLLEMQRPSSGAPLRFDDGAQAIRAELAQEHHALVRLYERMTKKLSTALGKQDAIFARLCVVWHCVEHAGQGDLPEVVTEDIARPVAAFMREFTRLHLMDFYGDILEQSDEYERLKKIAGYILVKELKEVTNRQVQAAVHSTRGMSSKEITPVMEQLESFGWLIRGRSRFGAPPRWMVNPAVHTFYEKRRVSEITRRRKEAERLAANVKGRRRQVDEDLPFWGEKCR